MSQNPKFTRKGNTDHTGKCIPIDQNLNCGTAGFRTNASFLPFVVFRMGALAALRSKVTKKVIGLMITASHNPELDNGVKLVDPMGEMLAQEWEKYATDVVNASDTDLDTVIKSLVANTEGSATVFCAYDTRESSKYLHDAAKEGVLWLGGEFVSYGLLATPQLHFMVRCTNDRSYGSPTEDAYYGKLAGAFGEICKSSQTSRQLTIFVDCANGVGAPKLRKLASKLNPDFLKVEIRNESGPLNYKCGADFVKIDRMFPEGLEVEVGQRWASFDGDADRIVYFYRRKDGAFRLLDGDKIAVLFADFIASTLALLGETDLTIGVVQTAYANGSSSDYIRDTLRVPVLCVPTGVKHLHHAAQQFDCGIYFEANGHGTVLFSEKFKTFLAGKLKQHLLSDLETKVKFLKNFVDLINETVGDAMSDLLAVEALLSTKDLTIQEWDKLYEDKASCQRKVTVKDRRLIKTVFDETKCLEPEGLQTEIDKIIAKQGGRAFVRPSGTEDIVRVYAEGESEAQAKETAVMIENVVVKFCS